MSQENVEIVRSILEPFKGIDVASIDLDDDGLREALGPAYSPDFELRTLDTGIGLGVDEVYRGWDGLVHYLQSVLAEADLLMAIDGYPTLAELRNNAIRRVHS